MPTQSNTQENPAATIVPPIQPRMPWRVNVVEALPSFKLSVRFVDGTEGIIDLTDEVHARDAGVFAALADPALFARVFVENGAVTWPGEIDMAPDAMYDQVKRNTAHTK
jgi:hypothetical protein